MDTEHTLTDAEVIAANEAAIAGEPLTGEQEAALAEIYDTGDPEAGEVVQSFQLRVTIRARASEPEAGSDITNKDLADMVREFVQQATERPATVRSERLDK